MMGSVAHMATTTLRVEGMTCGACTSAVESGFKGVEGAGSVSVSLVMSRAVIQHDPTKLPPEAIREIIEDCGFDAEVLSTDIPVADIPTNYSDIEPENAQTTLQSCTTTIAVEGMTCGACTSAVEGGFKDVAGVQSMSVSLLSERAVIEHDPSVITPEAIIEIIEDRGFGATVIETKAASIPPSRSASGRLGLQGSELTTTTVAIKDMTCAACTSAVEAGFKGLEGVVQFNISLLAERAVILHDANKLSASQILEIIDDRGKRAEILSSILSAVEPNASSRTTRLKVFGLQDLSAAASLEENLRALPGVASAVVKFSTSRIAIMHNPTITGLRALVETTQSLGYTTVVADADENSAQLESLSKTREILEWRRAFISALSFAIPVFLISMIFPMFIPRLDFGKLLLFLPGLYLGDIIALALTIPVQFGIGKRFYVSAYKSLKHGSPTMDVLFVLGTSAAFFYSVVAMIVSILFPPHSRPSTVFETSSMLITFISLGRYLENRAKGQTSKALSRLMSLAPPKAQIYVDPIAAQKAAESWDDANAMATEKKEDSKNHASHATEERTIDSELIEVGDIVILRPGDRIPADGIVLRGQSYIDESMVTGEAMEISKETGSNLLAGTVNQAGRVDFRVTRAGSDTQLSQIVKLVQEAQTSRAPIQRMADIVAGYFVPTIIGLGLLTFIGWMVLSHALPNPPKIFLKPESGGKLMVCVKLCISVIVFACPCALGLSTPTAVMVGTGVGAEQGILVKGGAALEEATKIDHIVFDKTGTLTMGKMSVADTKLEPTWDVNEWRRKLWWSLVGLTEMSTEHPIGKAILGAAKEHLRIGSEGMIDGTVGDFNAIVGKGIFAEVEPATSVERKRYRVHIGNADYLESHDITIPREAKAHPSASDTKDPNTPPSGTTQIYTAIDGIYTGVISLSDTIKPTAHATILALNRMNISSSMVTGDQLPTALAVAALVGIPETNIHAGVLPGQKQDIIKQIQAQGSKVAMVGDGINDSPALATANVGIALSSGTDVAMDTADIVLMRPEDLLIVAAALSLSRSIFNRIKLNLLWACLYNFIGLPFAMGFGLMLPHPVMLPPMAAGASMAMSSTSVVGSSLLLKLWKRPRWMNVEKLERGRVRKGDLKGMETSQEQGFTDRYLPASISRAIGRAVGSRREIDGGYVPLQDIESV